MTSESKYNEGSPSVQTHLSIIQNVIDRMSTNSASSKAWCIAIVSALVVVVAENSKPNLVFLGLIPTVLFAALDTYYLGLEKAFRESYRQFVRKVHDGTLTADDLYAVEPEGNTSKHQLKALASFSIWGFYLGLMILLGLAWWALRDGA